MWRSKFLNMQKYRFLRQGQKTFESHTAGVEEVLGNTQATSI